MIIVPWWVISLGGLLGGCLVVYWVRKDIMEAKPNKRMARIITWCCLIAIFGVPAYLLANSNRDNILEWLHPGYYEATHLPEPTKDAPQLFLEK